MVDLPGGIKSISGRPQGAERPEILGAGGCRSQAQQWVCGIDPGRLLLKGVW
jgi:hypothetical protein